VKNYDIFTDSCLIPCSVLPRSSVGFLWQFGR